MRKVHARDWEHLQSILFEDSHDKPFSNHRSPYVFRGQSNAEYDLRTSLIRLVQKNGRNPPKQRYKNVENRLLQDFSKYAYREAPNQSVWHLLSVAQHHKLPTRLLDWTFSPLVASHFATNDTDKFDTDGVIWKIDYEKAHRKLPEAFSCVLEDERPSVFTVDMLEGVVSSIRDEKERIEEKEQNMFGAQRYQQKQKPTKEKIEEDLAIDTDSISYQSIQDSLNEFDRISDAEFVIFFEPPSLDERIANQSALFSIMPKPNTRLDEWAEKHPEMGKKVIIPAELKPRIREYLDQANVTERVLFPGLDGLADWLKRDYTPNPKQKSPKPNN